MSQELKYAALLAPYDFNPLADETDINRIRSYAITRLIDLAESENQSIALGALTMLGKVADVALFSERLCIDIKQRPTAELEGEINAILSRYLNEKVINPPDDEV